LVSVVGFGTRHTLASYLSMHPAPDTIASTGHFASGPRGWPAARVALASSTNTLASSTNDAATMISSDTFLIIVLLPVVLRLLAPAAGSRWLDCTLIGCVG
jgi:hypothetical protein